MTRTNDITLFQEVSSRPADRDSATAPTQKMPVEGVFHARGLIEEIKYRMGFANATQSETTGRDAGEQRIIEKLLKNKIG